MNTDSIIFTLISCQHLPLAEYATVVGTFKRYAYNLHQIINLKVRYGSYSLKEYSFHYLNSEGLTFICLTHEDVSQNSAFSYLNEVYMQFFTIFYDLKVESILDDLIPFELNKAMLPKLKILSKKYFEYNVNGAELPVAIGMEGRQPLRLKERDIHLENHCAFRVQQTYLSKAKRPLTNIDRQQPPAFLARYPYLMVGICIVIAALALVYIIVAVFCGAKFEKCLSGHWKGG